MHKRNALYYIALRLGEALSSSKRLRMAAAPTRMVPIPDNSETSSGHV